MGLWGFRISSFICKDLVVEFPAAQSPGPLNFRRVQKPRKVQPQSRKPPNLKPPKPRDWSSWSCIVGSSAKVEGGQGRGGEGKGGEGGRGVEGSSGVEVQPPEVLMPQDPEPEIRNFNPKGAAGGQTPAPPHE